MYKLSLNLIGTLIGSCTLLLPATGASQTNNLLGSWVERTTVCDRHIDARDRKKPNPCRPHDNVLLVTRTGDPIKELKVQMALEFNNGYGCEFEGDALAWRNRIIARNEKTQCEIVFVHDGSRLHTVVRTEDRCQSHCGSFQSMDGATFVKGHSRKK